MRFTFIASLVTALLLVPTVRGVDVKYNNYGVFVPEELRFRDGNTNSPFPFLDEFGTNERIRYQQVFASSAFEALPKGGAYVTVIHSRADCLTTGRRAIVSTTNFNVWFSTTLKRPDEMSRRFDENVGSDIVKVRSRQEGFGMDNQGCLLPQGTDPLGPRIDLDVPFAYDPAKGNLLMEVHFQATGVPREPFFLDAEDVVGDPVSRLVARGFEAESANIAQDTVGIPVYFVFNGPPIISFETNALGLTLVWEDVPHGFKLQWTQNIQTSNNWQDYPDPVPNTEIVTVNIPRGKLGQTRYFRLFHPTLPPLGN